MPLKKGQIKSTEEVAETKEFDDLINDLSSSDAEVRRHAAISLEDEPSALSVMAGRLRHESDPQVMEALLIALLRHPSLEVAEEIFELIRDEDAGHRTVAVDALRQMPSDFTSFLGNYLKDDDPDVRILTANTLQEVAMDEVESLLLEQLLNEDHPNVVGAIVEALLLLGTDAAVEPLLEARERFEDEEFLTFSIDAAVDLVRTRGAE